uniref:ORF118 n=1 Tax=Pinus koraiensis TaxID=88728 RepID=A4QME6_PINKO|nr:ORF118 [Pinus koraiensis]ABP35483.1 ORF118 [Pinus koraiensis]
MLIRLRYIYGSIMVMLKFIRDPYKKIRNFNPFPVGRRNGMDRGMVEKFPIFTDWLKGSTVVKLINDRVPFVRPPLGVPEKKDFASLFSRVLEGGVVYFTGHPNQMLSILIRMIQRNHH